jgi:hypothetical protein
MRIARFRVSVLGDRPLAVTAFSLVVAGAFSCRPAEAGLVITPTFDSTITSDANAAAIENVITSAIATYETMFTDPINATITFGEMTTGLGESTTFFRNVSYSTFWSHLNLDQTTSSDATAMSFLAHVSHNPVNGASTINVKTANARAIGINANPPAGSTDGTVLVNTLLTDVGSPGNTGEFSLRTVAQHEIDEVLGLGSALPSPSNSTIFPEDLFRYSASGSRSFTTNSSETAFFSIDGTTDLAQFNQNSSGDFGDWQSNPLPPGTPPRVQDAFATPGASPMLGVELTALDVIGYDLVPQPFTGTGYWKNAFITGSWSNGNSWSALSPAGTDNAGEPGAGSTVYIANSDGTPRTINYDYTGAAITLNSLIIDLTDGVPPATTTLSMTANSLTSTSESIGEFGSGTLDQSGGANSISGGSLYIGDLAGSTGTYLLSGNGSLTVDGSEYIGFAGTGTINQSGGTHTTSAGQFLHIGYLTDSTGHYILSGGSLTAGGIEYLGFGGTGTFDQSGGTNTITAGNVFYIGFNSGSNGVYTLGGAGALTANGGEYIGASGVGTFNQMGGTHSVQGGPLCLACFSGSTGTYTLSGGTVTVGGSLYVGGSAVGPGGTGNVTVSGSGDLSVAGTLMVYGTPISSVTLSGGTIEAGSIVNQGGLTINSGALSVGDVTLNSASMLGIGLGGTSRGNQYGALTAVETSVSPAHWSFP